MKDKTFVTRTEYDRLVAACPEWMAENFPKLERHWNLYGVWVYGSVCQIEELLDRFRTLYL